MVTLQPNSKSKILSHLKKLAPFSVVERGIELASHDGVLECSSSGTTITGVVREPEGSTNTVRLIVVSSQDVEAECTCCAPSDMQEQWCIHAVAVLWRAVDLDFFDPHGGFSEREAAIRMASCSPIEIANTIREVHLAGEDQDAWGAAGVRVESGYTPDVVILVDASTDRLGIKLLFDNIEQEPSVFEGFKKASSRALDNILVHVLEDEGSWDEHSRLWYINSSRSIELVLGLIQEYGQVRTLADFKPIRFPRFLLDARLLIRWCAAHAELNMEWRVPPDGKAEITPEDHRIVLRNQEVMGTGPFWTIVDQSLYRLSPQAARIASVFGHSHSVSIPRSQVGPVIEALQDLEISISPTIIILNPEEQPKTEVKNPSPVLVVERRDVAVDHFTSSRQVELAAALDFEYPAPSPEKNIIFLRNRQKEDEFIRQLVDAGFVPTSDRRRYTMTGDAALDFLAERHEILTRPWKTMGLETIRKALRFSDLNVSVSLAGSSKYETEGEEQVEEVDSNWFSCSISLLQNASNVPLSAVFKNARTESDRWVRLDSGAYARVPGGSVGNLRTILGMVDPNCRLSNTIRARLSIAQAISLSRVNDTGFSVQLDKRLSQLAAHLDNFAEIPKIATTKGFTGKLRHYQEDGISWLLFLHDLELGGILADEMGLGKTVQALAFFQYLRDKRAKKEGKKPVLIVAPTSVITNWSYEIRKFVPEMKPLMLHGPQRKSLFPEIPNHDFVLTSYALLRLDRYDLEKYDYSYVVLDEAQNIKNPQAATTKAAKSLRTKRRLALTGTPTENRPMELWSIMDFLMPGYLGSFDFFRTNIERPIMEGGPAVQVAQMLNSKTRPFILRRIKSEVEKELPPKIESVLHVDMTPSQRQLYAEILAEVRPKVFDAVERKGIRGASVSILAALLRLRQVCNHPNSIDALADAPGYESGKFLLLKDLVEEALESGRKILFFSQFRAMLGIVRNWLNEKAVNYLYLDGATKNRQDLIDKFTTDESVRLFLISLKAGGAGLNLMAADTVIIYDPWWNPAVESQAVDRAHRIGQNKTVAVYRLVTEDSVEQKIMALKARKSRIVDALINENGLSTINLSKADLESLFSPMSAATADGEQ